MSDSPLRLFAGIAVPPELQQEIARATSPARRGLRGWRWVRPEALHVTLRFFGPTARDRVPRLRAALDRAASSSRPLRLAIGSWGVFPARRRPSVLWRAVEGDVEGLGRLASSCESAARECGYPPETRAFHPHLTLARARRDERAVPPEIDEATSIGELVARILTLYSSRLGPGGARYEVVDAFPLGRGVVHA